MKGDPLPATDHVARLCKSTTVDPSTLKPSATAFVLREKEPDLSVNWLEFLAAPSRPDEMSEVRRVYAVKLKSVGARARIAVLNVGGTIAYVQAEHGTLLSARHEPEVPIDPSHAGIFNLPDKDDPASLVVGKLIAETVLETHSAR